MASLLFSMGVLATEKFVETSAKNLQGSYIGQTKDKVIEVFTKAQGGVLFVDEA